jgi:hypothetical protein
MTKQQLINNATAKNFKLQFSQDEFGNELVGINKNKSCYHWFKVYFGGNVFFDHTYSCNTGNVKRGFNHGFKITESLEK